MNGDRPGEETPADLSGKYVEEAVFFVVNWHAATVNMRLYPPTSSMVTETVENARAHLESMLAQSEQFGVSVLENNLLINDVRLDEIEQQKAPVRSFVQWMNERGLTSLEFKQGVSAEEVSTVFEVLSAPPDHRVNLSEVLVERGVVNVTLNQRVYVAVTSGEEVDGIRKASPLDTLKDELLMRYLMGKVDLGQVEDRELVEVLSDQGKVGGLISTFIREEGSEGGILVRSEKAEEALIRLSEMVDSVEDEQLRAVLSEQIGGIISEMSPREMTSVLTGEGPENLNLSQLRERVLTILGDKELLEMVDSLINDYMDMKAESDELETDWQREKLRHLNELLVEMREERGEELAQVVDQKLEAAGIVEERDPETGRRVLSAYQLLGGPIEEEFVELAEGIDQTVSEQIHRLYSMEERELASGMLEKLVENLRQESAKVRRFAAQLVKETLEALDREYQLMAAALLEKQLIDDVRAETDYGAYVPQVDSVAALARAYMQEGLADEAADIVELLKEQSGPDNDKGPELVKHAAAVLERLTGPEGMVDAQALLKEEDLEKRLVMTRGLAALGPSALTPIVDVVKDRGQIDLRERAMEAIREAGDVGVEALLAQLDMENPWYVYRNVLNVIAELKLVEAAGRVAEMVRHPDERIRREAVRSLARIGSRQSVLPVMEAATSDQSPAVRRTAVRVLGMFSDSSVAPFLIELMNGQGPRGRDEDQAVVEAACLALGDLKDGKFVAPLVDLLSKGGLFKKARPDEIRAAACIALGSIGDQAVASTLERATRDPSMMVRSSAEKALRKLTGVVTVPQPVPREEREAEVEQKPPPFDAYRPSPHPEAADGLVVEEAPEEVGFELVEQLPKKPGEPGSAPILEEGGPDRSDVDRPETGPAAAEPDVSGGELEAELEPYPRPAASGVEGERSFPARETPEAMPGDALPFPEGPPPGAQEPPAPSWLDMLVPPVPPASRPGTPCEAGLDEPAAAGKERPDRDEYLPPPIPPDDIYIDNLAGEEGVYLVHDPEPDPDDRSATQDEAVPPPVDDELQAGREGTAQPFTGRQLEPTPGQAVEMPAEWMTPAARQEAPADAAGPAVVAEPGSHEPSWPDQAPGPRVPPPPPSWQQPPDGLPPPPPSWQEPRQPPAPGWQQPPPGTDQVPGVGRPASEGRKLPRGRARGEKKPRKRR